MVIGLTILLTTGAALLATNVVEHNPLVQSDVVQHYAYRALEAGINSYLTSVNANPNEITCNHLSPSPGQCNPSDYDQWKQVDNTSGSGVVPEWYLWEDPVFCFGSVLSGTPPTCPTSGTTLSYVKVTVIGAAGLPGKIQYQSSAANLIPINGFLTHIWWTNYEATDPHLQGAQPTACTYDYDNGYNGPDLGSGNCFAVYFDNHDVLNGPIYSNDSLYIDGSGPPYATLGPVTTADPNCLFVTGPPGPHNSSNCTVNDNIGASTLVTQTASDLAASQFNHAIEPIPPATTASALATYASLDGCLYTGPTTITFDANDQMTVWSPDTPSPDWNQGAGAPAENCMPSATPTDTSAPVTVQVPNGVYGNGVIYVQGASGTCATANAGTGNGANPFDNWNTVSNKLGPKAQWGYHSAIPIYYNYFGSTSTPDCEADAFVSDNPGSGGSPLLPNSTPGGITGQLTVGSANDVVVTGNIQYLDCEAQGGFNSGQSWPSGTCAYNPPATGTPNDVVGLIAYNYILVNHPVAPNCSGPTCTGISSGNVTLEGDCAGTGTLGAPAAALCDPGPNVTIDAAILALVHSFAVDNFGLGFPVGPPEGTLTIYGALDQNWRGTVGNYSGSTVTSGYTKDYSWDNRVQYVTPPYYLSPGTNSWGLASSATILDLSAPSASACNSCGIP